jgi:hypothetical protein
MAKNSNVYIEPRATGQFAVMKADGERASGLCDAQAHAERDAKRMFRTSNRSWPVSEQRQKGIRINFARAKRLSQHSATLQH